MDKHPSTKPHYLKNGFYSVIKKCSEDTENKFAEIQEFDGKFDGIVITKHFTKLR